jgi:hypothetical protein
MILTAWKIAINQKIGNSLPISKPFKNLQHEMFFYYGKTFADVDAAALFALLLHPDGPEKGHRKSH